MQLHTKFKVSQTLREKCKISNIHWAQRSTFKHNQSTVILQIIHAFYKYICSQGNFYTVIIMDFIVFCVLSMFKKTNTNLLYYHNNTVEYPKFYFSRFK